MARISGSAIDLEEKFMPYLGGNIKDKTAWTEKRLQALQTKLFEMFKECESNCNTCKDRVCDEIVGDMEKYLLPYGISIFKRAFKWRATLEEFDRVVTESVNALLMDIWAKKKVIHSSFGSMLKWKMVYYLDGNINLFDNERFRSLDQWQDSFPNNGEFNGEDVIEYYKEVLNEERDKKESFDVVNRKQAVSALVDLLEVSKDTYNKYLSNKEQYAIHIRSIFGFIRFLKNKDNYLMFKNRSKARYYYEKTLDVLRVYLKKQGIIKYKKREDFA